MRVSGFAYVRKRKRGDAWYLKYRVGEKRFNRKLGPAWKEKGRPPTGYYTKKKAQEELQAVLTDARRGKAGAHKATINRTYQEAVLSHLRYLEDSGRSPSTIQDYEHAAKKRLYPAFGKDAPVSSITTRKIDKLREDLQSETELKPRTIQKLLAFNYSVLKRAKRLGWITSNPAEDAERITIKRSGDFNVLSPEEVAALARAAANDQDRVIYTVAAYTGLRMGELRALRWRDVDFASSNVFVRKNHVRDRTSTPKSGKVRSVPLIDLAAKVLDELSRRDNFTGPDDRVFVEEDGSHIDDWALRMRFYEALKQAGLGHKREENPPLRFHDLRHTFGTLGVQAWPLRDLQAYMGHANITTTEGYAHHVPKRNAAAALTELIETESEPTSRDKAQV
jgi:integrase